MAQKYLVQLVDDLSEEPIEDGAGESVRFSLDGVGYVIDLTAAHADELRQALAPYTAVARKGDHAPAGKQKQATSASRKDLKEIRAWAAQNGHAVAERGRIPADVVSAYDLAH